MAILSKALGVAQALEDLQPTLTERSHHSWLLEHDREVRLITCVLHYEIDPRQIAAFERFAKAWIYLVNKHGGRHHGYFLPSEGASDRALALFTFESFATYERYRSLFGTDPEFARADRIRDESGCVLRYERTFMKPVLPDDIAGFPD